MKNPYLDENYQLYNRSVLLGTAIAFIVVSILFVAVRFYARSLTRAHLGLDDFMTVLSLMICIGLSVNQICAATVGGVGKHHHLPEGQMEITPQLAVYEKTKFVSQILGILGLCFTKLSMLFFFRRIFSTRLFRKINDALIAITFIWGTSFFFVIVFQCAPVSVVWTELEMFAYTKCIKPDSAFFGIAVSDLLLDVLICILPIPQLWSLQMPLRRKFAVAGLFLLGSIVIACSIARVVISRWVIEFVKSKPEKYFNDVTWYSSGALFWHVAENVIALIGCCLPIYKPLFTRHGANRRPFGTSISRHTALSSSKGRTEINSNEELGDEWPLHPTGGAVGKSMASSSGGAMPEDHAMRPLPKNRIMVQTEVQTETITLRNMLDI